MKKALRNGEPSFLYVGILVCRNKFLEEALVVF